MDILLSVLETALPVLVVLLLGMLCRQKHFLSREGVEDLKNVALNICLPAVLVNAFATMSYTPSTLIIPLIQFLLCGLTLGLGLILAKWMKLDRIFGYLGTGFEAGMIGYTLFALLYPQEPTSSFAILDPGHTLFIFTVYKLTLLGKHSGRSVIREIVTSPVILAVAGGVLLGATGLYGALEHIGLSATVDALTGFIGAPTGMLILLCIGYDLDLKQLQWKQLSRLLLLRLICAGTALAILLGLNQLLGGVLHVGAAVLFCILPPCYVLPIFSTDDTQRAALSSAISAWTLITIVLFAVMAFLVV